MPPPSIERTLTAAIVRANTRRCARSGLPSTAVETCSKRRFPGCHRGGASRRPVRGMSYCDSMFYGVAVDPAVIGDPSPICEGIERAAGELGAGLA
jgi:hypothetical protein